jgi:hypothetical protein
MKSILLIIKPWWLALGLLYSGCDSAEVEVKNMIFSAQVYQEGSKEVFRISGASQKGKVLEICGTYTGGCIDQEPDLVWGFEMGLSLPPFVPIKVVLPKSDDCEKQVSKTWRFDLEELFKLAHADVLLLSIEGLDSGYVKVKKK